MSAPKDPPRFPFDGSKIPGELKVNARWAPWKAIFDSKRGKYDKVPCRTDGYGLSTGKPQLWYSYEDAEAAYLADTATFAGVGYVLTKPHGMVGIDLDNCVEDDSISDWAIEIITQLASYTEISPSGNGLRVWLSGTVPRDWTNHQVGVEVYGGNQPRFLTVTGQRLRAFPATLTEGKTEVFAALEGQYARAKVKTDAITLQMPDLVDEMLMPALDGLGLRYKTLELLEDGKAEGDRSGLLFASSVDLYSAGLTDEEVFTTLATNVHVMEIALGHRNQNVDRALQYLWVEHCQKARGRATSKVATADDFDDVSEPKGTSMDAGAVATVSVAPPARFKLQKASVFAQGATPTWIIKGVLPAAELLVIYGESGSGKSFIALDMACSIARGLPWREKKVRQGKVVYIAAEGAMGFRKRLNAYATANSIPVTDLDENFFVINDAPNFLEKGDALDICRSIAAIGQVSLVIVDTWAQVLPGANENSGEDMGRALAHCKGIHRSCGGMVALIHHSGKDASKGARGWSGLRAASDAEFEVTKLKDGHNIRCTKQKDGETDGVYGFGLTVVPMGMDADEEPITSCVVVAKDVAKAAVRRGAIKFSKGWGLAAVIALGDWFAINSKGVALDDLVVSMLSCPPPDSAGQDLTDATRQARKMAKKVVADDESVYQMDDKFFITLKE